MRAVIRRIVVLGVVGVWTSHDRAGAGDSLPGESELAVLRSTMERALESDRTATLLPEGIAQYFEFPPVEPGASSLLRESPALTVERLTVPAGVRDGPAAWDTLRRLLGWCGPGRRVDVEFLGARPVWAELVELETRLVAVGEVEGERRTCEVLALLKRTGESVTALTPLRILRARSARQFTAAARLGTTAPQELGWSPSLGRASRLEGRGRAGGGAFLLHDVDGDGAVDLWLAGNDGLAHRLFLGLEGEDRAADFGLDRRELVLDARFADLDGDGVAELLLAGEALIVLHRSRLDQPYEALLDPIHPPVRSAVFTAVRAGDYDSDGLRDLLLLTHLQDPRQPLRALPQPLMQPRNGPGAMVLRQRPNPDGPQFQPHRADWLPPAGTLAADARVVAHAGGDRALVLADGASWRDVDAGEMPYDIELVRPVLRGRVIVDHDLDGDGDPEQWLGVATDAYAARAHRRVMERGGIAVRLLRDVESSFRGPWFVDELGPLQPLEFSGGMSDPGPVTAALSVDLDGDGRAELCVGTGRATLPAECWDEFFAVAQEQNGPDEWRAWWERRIDEGTRAGGAVDRCYVALGDGEFLDVAWLWGLDTLGEVVSLAALDRDGDGDRDLLVRDCENAGVVWWRNDLDTPVPSEGMQPTGTESSAWSLPVEPVPVPPTLAAAIPAADPANNFQVRLVRASAAGAMVDGVVELAWDSPIGHFLRAVAASELEVGTLGDEEWRFWLNAERQVVALGAGVGDPQFLPALASSYAGIARTEIWRRRMVAIARDVGANHALELAEAVVEEDPVARSVAPIAARLAFAEGDLALTRVWCERVPPGHPDRAHTQTLLGRTLLAQRELERARAALAIAERLRPADAEVVRWLGEALWRLGEVDRSESLLHRAFYLGATDPDFLERFAEARLATGYARHAAQLCRELEQQRPGRRSLQLLRARAERTAGDLEAAGEALDALDATGADDPFVQIERVFLDLDQGDHAAAASRLGGLDPSALDEPGLRPLFDAAQARLRELSGDAP